MGALFGQDVAAPPLRNVVEKGRQLEVYKSVRTQMATHLCGNDSLVKGRQRRKGRVIFVCI